jgi:hypothetical protein
MNSGNAGAGHYYAYVFSFACERWLCFNDAAVTWLSDGDLDMDFGVLPPPHVFASDSAAATPPLLPAPWAPTCSCTAASTPNATPVRRVCVCVCVYGVGRRVGLGD